MAEELTLEPDYSPIDEGALSVYELASFGGSPVAFFGVKRVTAMAPFAGVRSKREFDVEVEIDLGRLGLDAESFEQYLATFKDARISQESMSALIEKHLREALNTDKVFVEVKRRGPHKTTDMGAAA